MSAVCHLRLTDSTGADPDVGGVEIAWARYSVPFGWMSLFTPEDLLRFSDLENPHIPLSFYRAPRTAAITRLERTIDAIEKRPYLSSYFLGSLRALREALTRRTGNFVEVDYVELSCMGRGRFPARITHASHVFLEVVAHLEGGRWWRGRRRLNWLGPLCGMKLLGYRSLDHLWWWLDRWILGIPTDEELCRWWAIGVLESTSEGI